MTRFNTQHQSLGRATTPGEVPPQTPPRFWMKTTNAFCPVYVFLNPCLGTKNKILGNWRLIQDLMSVCVSLSLPPILPLSLSRALCCCCFLTPEASEYFLKIYALWQLYGAYLCLCVNPTSFSCSLTIGKLEANREERLAVPMTGPTVKSLLIGMRHFGLELPAF